MADALKNTTKISTSIANELSISVEQVDATIKLLEEGATIPFIARYRKEATKGLDDIQLRKLQERLEYLTDLFQQKETAITTIQSQGKLTEALSLAFEQATTKQEVADLYLPYRPKRKTKASQAIEAGLEPLALQLFEDPNLDPETQAGQFLNTEQGIETTKQALDGALQILIEKWSENPQVIQTMREKLKSEGFVHAQVKKDKKNHKNAPKYKDYFNFSEALHKIPSHRTLAIFRGRKEGIISIEIGLADPENKLATPFVDQLKTLIGYTPTDRPADSWLTKAVEWAWRVKLQPKLETDLLNEVKEKADLDSIQVFTKNLKNLLMSAPAGQLVCLGLDPGIRTGVKAAVVDGTGQLLAHTSVFPHAPKNLWQESIDELLKLVKAHGVQIIAIGNGTASRETDKLVIELIQKTPELGLKKIVVSEAGASVYSASEYASKELPDIDVSFRGAVSIARRLQDPLAELVKIEPKAIGVGQYQHDVNQNKLSKSLDHVIEDCVNAVGVDVNTASAPLLARIAGLNMTIAQNLINFRNQNGAFASRDALKGVPRFGKRTFEQAAGFLRIANAENPLDATAVHPESYPLVENIAEKLNLNIKELVGNSAALNDLNIEQIAAESQELVEFTLKDIIEELNKPGRDPRPDFKTVEFRDDIKDIKDLKIDLVLNGVVTNVTNFGAFVDIGVHHDGLVHISVLSNQFVSDPHLIVQAGDLVKVKVIGVDIDRERIDLSMRLNESADQQAAQGKKITQNSHKTAQNTARNNPNRDFKKPAHGKGNGARKNNHNKDNAKKPRQNAKTSAQQALPPGKTGTFADLFAGLKE